MADRPSIVASAARGRCPRCGTPGLFAGLIRFAPACSGCGLDFTAFNVGDGPAAFLTLIVGALVVIGAVSLQLAAAPPLWLHLLLWPLVSVALIIGGLRLAKGALIALEYRHLAPDGARHAAE